jgi:biotin carboxylase
MPDTGPDSFIVLMGPHPPLCERAKRAGLGVIAIDTPEKATMGVIKLADHFIATDYTDVEQTADLLWALRARLDIVGVLSLTEPGLLPSAQVNERLGIPDNPVDVVRRIVDKNSMRQWLAREERFAVPARLVHTPAELREFADRYGLPVIVKPVDGAASEGVRIISAVTDLADTPGPDGSPLLVEKFLSGREFSVEAVSLDGRHTIVGITEKAVSGRSPNRFVEVGHRFPAPLADEEEKEIRSFVEAFLDLLGLRRGLSHTEVMLGDGGPAIIETHSRNGGDHITDLVLLATGFDMLDFAITSRSGHTTQLPATPTPQRGAAIRYFTPPPGVVREVYGHRTARYLPNVVDLELDLAAGTVVRPMASSDDRVGYVIAMGQDATDAGRHCDQAVKAVTVRMR